jgi:hypothetical protein
MKRLAILSTGVLIALIGFIAVLYFLPCENHGGCCGHDKMSVSCGKTGHHEMHMKGDHHEGGCGHQEMCGDGKGACMHKEIRVEMHGGGCGHDMMKAGCGDGMNEGCRDGGTEMQMGCQMPSTGKGCCCCCMMMMGGKMDSVKMNCVIKKDSVVIRK